MGRFYRDFSEVTYREPKESRPHRNKLPTLPRTHTRQAKPCKARRTDGEPCGNYAIKGGDVCVAHGGSAPQTVAAARARLLAAADPLMAELIAIALDRSLEPRDRMVAQRDALDRAGLSARQAVELTVKPWEQTLQDIVAAAGGEVVIEGDVLEGELVAADDDGETPDSASTRDSELRRQSAVDWPGSDRPQGTVDPHQEANRAQLARQRRMRRPTTG